MRPGLLRGSSLDRALGIWDDRGCVSVCVVCFRVSLLEDVRGSGCGSGVLIVGVIAAGVALGIGFGAVLNLHFLRKRRFLSVIHFLLCVREVASSLSLSLYIYIYICM